MSSRMMLSGSRLAKAAAWLLAVAVALPATTGAIGAACCVMQAPCCPEMTPARDGRPDLSGPVPACCEQIAPAERTDVADRSARGADTPSPAILVLPAPAPRPLVARIAPAWDPSPPGGPPLPTDPGRAPPSPHT